MIEPTGYHKLYDELAREIVNHGWGEMTFKVSSLKDNSVRVEVACGKSYVFFVKKNIDLDGF